MYNNYVELFGCKKYFTKMTKEGFIGALMALQNVFESDMNFEQLDGWVFATISTGYDYDNGFEIIHCIPLTINGKREGSIHDIHRPI